VGPQRRERDERLDMLPGRSAFGAIGAARPKPQPLGFEQLGFGSLAEPQAQISQLLSILSMQHPAPKLPFELPYDLQSLESSLDSLSTRATTDCFDFKLPSDSPYDGSFDFKLPGDGVNHFDPFDFKLPGDGHFDSTHAFKLPGDEWNGWDLDTSQEQDVVDTPAEMDLETTVEQIQLKGYTTLMVHGVPNRIMCDDILPIFESLGFAPGDFDYLYMPLDNRNLAGAKRKSNLGYLFVNCATPDIAGTFARRIQNYQFAERRGPKPVHATLASCQGVRPNVANLVTSWRKTKRLRKTRANAVWLRLDEEWQVIPVEKLSARLPNGFVKPEAPELPRPFGEPITA